MDYLKTVVPSQFVAERGANLIVINPGSANIKIGLATQDSPLIIPHCIARRTTGANIPPRKNALDQTLNSQITTAQHVERERAYDTIASYLKIPSLNEEVSNPYSRKMARLDGPNLPSRKMEPAFSWTDVFEEKPFSTSGGSMNSAVIQQSDLNKDAGLNEIAVVSERKYKEFICGEEALRISPCEPYCLRRPIRRGRFNVSPCYSAQQVLEDLSAIWEWILAEKLHIPMSQRSMCSAILVVPETFDHREIKELLSIILGNLCFGVAVIHQEALATVFGNGLSTACVVNIGAQVTSVICVEDGVALPATGVTLSFGGEDISRCLLWTQRHHQTWPLIRTDAVAKPIDLLMLNQLKESYCEIKEGETDAVVVIHSYEDGMPAGAHKTRLTALNECICPLERQIRRELGLSKAKKLQSVVVRGRCTANLVSERAILGGKMGGSGSELATLKSTLADQTARIRTSLQKLMEGFLKYQEEQERFRAEIISQFARINHQNEEREDEGGSANLFETLKNGQEKIKPEIRVAVEESHGLEYDYSSAMVGRARALDVGRGAGGGGAVCRRLRVECNETLKNSREAFGPEIRAKLVRSQFTRCWRAGPSTTEASVAPTVGGGEKSKKKEKGREERWEGRFLGRTPATGEGGQGGRDFEPRRTGGGRCGGGPGGGSSVEPLREEAGFDILMEKTSQGVWMHFLKKEKEIMFNLIKLGKVKQEIGPAHHNSTCTEPNNSYLFSEVVQDFVASNIQPTIFFNEPIISRMNGWTYARGLNLNFGPTIFNSFFSHITSPPKCKPNFPNNSFKPKSDFNIIAPKTSNGFRQLMRHAYRTLTGHFSFFPPWGQGGILGGWYCYTSPNYVNNGVFVILMFFSNKGS